MVDVSVVIATYNRSRQVREAIDGVLAQSVPVREIIVVDDGSKDDTRAQLLAYGDRIRPFFQANAGASAARNLAMRMAKGSWIAFLDDDDVWVREKIEQQWALVEKDPSLGLVYCSDYAVDEQLKVLYERTAQVQNRGEVFERLLIKNFIFTSCVIARRDAVVKAGYMQPEYKFAQDWDLWLKIAAEHPVDFAPAPLVLYRQSATGCLTHDMKADDRLLEMKTIMQRAFKLREVSGAARRRAEFEIESQWASASLVGGKNAAAFPHALRAVAAQPASLEGYRLMAHSLVPSNVRSWAKKMMGRNGATPVATTEKPKQPATPPPVIIMNMFYSGLAIARDLAGTGVRVIGLSSDPKAYGNFTRT